jgi:hypothetical protein
MTKPNSISSAFTAFLDPEAQRINRARQAPRLVGARPSSQARAGGGRGIGLHTAFFEKRGVTYSAPMQTRPTLPKCCDSIRIGRSDCSISTDPPHLLISAISISCIAMGRSIICARARSSSRPLSCQAIIWSFISSLSRSRQTKAFEGSARDRLGFGRSRRSAATSFAPVDGKPLRSRDPIACHSRELAGVCRAVARPEFLPKLRDILALYVDPPAHAIGLRVDEKPADPGARSDAAGTPRARALVPIAGRHIAMASLRRSLSAI